jgi:putative ABC transport system permease protein
MGLLSFIRTLRDFVFRRSRIEREMDEEFRSHIKLRAAELERQGLSRPEAERRARIEFGGYQKYKDECREALGTRLLQELIQDFRYGLRQLRRNPGFTVVVILTLALGIGATTAIFSVVYGAVLNPFPYTDSHRMAVVISHDEGGPGSVHFAAVSPAEFLDYREQNHVFDWVIGGTGDGVIVTGTGLPQWMDVARVTGNFFQSVGGKPVVGRTITPADCKPGAPPVVVLSYKTWVGKFNRYPKVVGRTLILDRQPTTIVGVMPPRFVPFAGEAFLPEILSPADTSSRRNSLFVIGHLKPGVTFQQANADIVMLARRFARTYPKDHPKEVSFTAEPYVRAVFNARDRSTILVLFGGVGLLLMIACVNVANLLLARVSTRQHEIAIRSALGASRARLVRQFLLESLLLAAGGSVLGSLLAWSGLGALVALIPDWYIPSEAVIQINFTVLLFTAGVAVTSTLLFGLVPALIAARKDLQIALSVSGHTTGQNPSRHWLRNPLVASEVALSLVLLTSAGLLFRNFWMLRHVRLGYNTSNILRVFIGLPEDRYKTAEQKSQFYLEALRRLRTLPGTVSVTLGWPNLERARFAQVQVSGQSGTGTQEVWFRVVGDQFFKTVGIPLLSGRTISDEDLVQRRHVAVVNRAFVNEYFAGANPLGQQVKVKLPVRFPPIKSDGFEIVGVVANTTHFQFPDPVLRPQVFLPFTVPGASWNQADIRTAGNPAALTNAVQKLFAGLDKDLPVEVGPIRLSDQMVEPRFITWMLVGFALMGIALVSIGVYGVLSYSVSRRTQEIGVRIALGAEASDVHRMVLMWGLRWLAIGIGIGVAASVAVEKVLQNRIWGLKTADPLTFIAVSLILVIVALVACYIPARRAAKVDPMVALRYE